MNTCLTQLHTHTENPWGTLQQNTGPMSQFSTLCFQIMTSRSGVLEQKELTGTLRQTFTLNENADGGHDDFSSLLSLSRVRLFATP